MKYEENPSKAVELFLCDEYIYHNPSIGDGIDPCIEYFNKIIKEFLKKNIEFVRAITKRDLVSLHTHQIWPGGEEDVAMDFFQFDEK